MTKLKSKRRWRVLIIVLLFGFVVGNVLAWRHARAMFRYDREAVVKTNSPESLGFWPKIGVLFNGVTIPRPANGIDPSEYKLDFLTHRFPNDRGYELESWLIPAAAKESHSETIVLMFHGYTAAKADLLAIAKVLHAEGHTCALIDAFGSGGSSGDSTSFGYFEATDVKASVAHYRKAYPGHKIVLYGISMGGAAAMRACAELGVKPDGLIAESVFPDFRGTIAKRFELMGLPAFPAADVLIFWGGVDLGIRPRSHNPRDYAKKNSDSIPRSNRAA